MRKRHSKEIRIQTEKESDIKIQRKEENNRQTNKGREKK
jgi:hypothetical protein